jgi:DNA-binding HxlR family transcriptional regulator
MKDKNELIDEIIKMDDLSRNVILTLYVYGKLRFNQLNRALKEFHLKVSSPTLADCLKFLVQRKWVIRKREGKQYVSYELNMEKASALEESPEDIKESFLTLENVEKLASEHGWQIVEPTPEEDIEMLIKTVRQELIAEIQWTLKTKNPSELSRYLWYKGSFYRRLVDGIIQNCLENLDYRSKIVRLLKEDRRCN